MGKTPAKVVFFNISEEISVLCYHFIVVLNYVLEKVFIMCVCVCVCVAVLEKGVKRSETILFWGFLW